MEVRKLVGQPVHVRTLILHAQQCVNIRILEKISEIDHAHLEATRALFQSWQRSNVSVEKISGSIQSLRRTA